MGGDDVPSDGKAERAEPDQGARGEAPLELTGETQRIGLRAPRDGCRPRFRPRRGLGLGAPSGR